MSVYDPGGLEETLFWLSEPDTRDAIRESRTSRDTGGTSGADVRAMLAEKLAAEAHDAD